VIPQKKKIVNTQDDDDKTDSNVSMHNISEFQVKEEHYQLQRQ